MPNDPLAWWKSGFEHADFSEPEVCRKRATRFERTVRRRNLIEGGAGALVIVLFGSAVIAAANVGEWTFAAAGALVVAGTAFILWHLYRRGSNLPRRPEVDCRTHLLAQLVRQRDLLRRVPQWYLAPLLPGICAIYGITAMRVAETQGWETALGGIWEPFATTMAFFVFVACLNLWAARRLAREIAMLDSLS